MRLIALAALPLIAATAPPPLKPCANPAVERADAREPIRPRKLGEMPPGAQMLAVYRSVDGCAKPVVVRRDVGQPRR